MENPMGQTIRYYEAIPKKAHLLDFLCMKQSYPKSDETDIQTMRTGYLASGNLTVPA